MSNVISTDEELFANFVDGDEDSLNQLHARYRPLLARYVHERLRDPSAIDEIVHLTFIRVVQNKHRFTPDKLFKPWVYTIADRLTKDYRKVSGRRSRRTRSFSDFHSAVDFNAEGDASPQDKWAVLVDPSAAPAGDTLSQKESSQQALSLLRSLPKKLRNTIQFSVLQGLSSREAAAIFGLSHMGIQKRINAGLDILRKQMESGLHGDLTTALDVRECSIRDLVDSLPDTEYAAVQRVLFEECGTDQDHSIFADFLRRLVGELVSRPAAVA